MGLATDTTVYLNRQREALKANKLTSAIHASDSSWHPGLSGPPSGSSSLWRGSRSGLLPLLPFAACKGTSFTRNSPSVGPYSSPLFRDLWTCGGPRGVGVSYERGTPVRPRFPPPPNLEPSFFWICAGSGPILSYTMYLLFGLRKSTPPQNCQLNISISNSKQ